MTGSPTAPTTQMKAMEFVSHPFHPFFTHANADMDLCHNLSFMDSCSQRGITKKTGLLHFFIVVIIKKSLLLLKNGLNNCQIFSANAKQPIQLQTVV